MVPVAVKDLKAQGVIHPRVMVHVLLDNTGMAVLVKIPKALRWLAIVVAVAPGLVRLVIALRLQHHPQQLQLLLQLQPQRHFRNLRQQTHPHNPRLRLHLSLVPQSSYPIV